MNHLPPTLNNNYNKNRNNNSTIAPNKCDKRNKTQHNKQSEDENLDHHQLTILTELGSKGSPSKGNNLVKRIDYKIESSLRKLNNKLKKQLTNGNSYENLEQQTENNKLTLSPTTREQHQRDTLTSNYTTNLDNHLTSSGGATNATDTNIYRSHLEHHSLQLNEQQQQKHQFGRLQLLSQAASEYSSWPEATVGQEHKLAAGIDRLAPTSACQPPNKPAGQQYSPQHQHPHHLDLNHQLPATRYSSSTVSTCPQVNEAFEEEEEARSSVSPLDKQQTAATNAGTGSGEYNQLR